MKELFDCAIIGAGLAGSMAALKIAKEHKKLRTILFDVGARPLKRKRQTDGFLGCLPGSDGKLYLNDLKAVAELTTPYKSKRAYRWFNDYMSEILSLKVIKDKSPNTRLENKIKKSGFNIKLNNYIQMYPRDIHILAKSMNNPIREATNLVLSFDNEVIDIKKEKKTFIVSSDIKQIECKRLIICTGRSGWRWTKQLYDTFGIIESNDVAKFGIRIEASDAIMKDFNRSNCSLIKDDIDIGPLCWYGTVIPEDHFDLAISSFRSNESRWGTDKVSFNLIGSKKFENAGVEQINRIGQLSFILTNERVIKERISTLMNKKSKISILKEYDWIRDAIVDISQFIPDLINKGYFHTPTIVPMIPKIQLDSKLLTGVSGMYCAGEAAGVHGLLAAAVTGLIAADSACR